MNEIRKQEPSNPDNWLHDGAQDYTRIFSKLVYLGKDAEPWAECTEAERLAWIEQHPQPEPEYEEPVEQPTE